MPILNVSVRTSEECLRALVVPPRWCEVEKDDNEHEEDENKKNNKPTGRQKCSWMNFQATSEITTVNILYDVDYYMQWRERVEWSTVNAHH